MECGCKVPTKKLLVEGEYGADPVWCAVCEYNIELDELPVDKTLQDALLMWGNAYGQWIDLEQGVFTEGGERLEAAHNKEGVLLAKKLQLALSGYEVSFTPSAM
ncbi:MAG: hypothetical protein ABS948_04400 [Solibacillus sp.]